MTPFPEECPDELLLLPVLVPNAKPVTLPLPNTWFQQLSTSALERLPDNAVTHLINLLLVPVLVLLDVRFLLLLVSLGSEPLLLYSSIIG